MQKAVNIIASSPDNIKIVQLPEGDYDFLTSSWKPLKLFNGVQLFGYPTIRDPNGQVISWGTRIHMPFEAPENSLFFEVTDSTKPRITDIQLIGYREKNSASKTKYRAASFNRCTDLRVDHCNFYNIAGQCIQTFSSNGVIDHNRLINDKNVYVTAAYNDCTVLYAVAVNGDGVTWEPLSEVLGKYTKRTVFIEDCHFEGWRHAVMSHQRGHYVYRHNTEANNGYGTVDAHGREGTGQGEGTRLIEVYENSFSSPKWGDFAIQLRGGAAVIFNNKAEGYGTKTSPSDYSAFVVMAQYTPDTYPEQQIKDVYIYKNSLLPTDADIYDASYGDKNPVRLNQEFFLTAPANYIQYSYPHPLTIEGGEKVMKITNNLSTPIKVHLIRDTIIEIASNSSADVNPAADETITISS